MEPDRVAGLAFSTKQRSYVVDYIGLANHLTEALSLYAAADEAQELSDSMKSMASEPPAAAHGP